MEVVEVEVTDWILVILETFFACKTCFLVIEACPISTTDSRISVVALLTLLPRLYAFASLDNSRIE